MVVRRNKLNDKQLQLLKLVYKFRFVTTSLAAKHKGVLLYTINNAFSILMDQGLVDRRYDNTYRIAGKSARYYLTPKGLRLLRDMYSLDEAVIRSMYKNKTVGEAFIDDCLTIMDVYLSLREAYPDAFNMFTKSELGGFDYFPVPKPSLYLMRIEPQDDLPDSYMLDIVSDTRFFVTKKRIDQYIEHYDSGDWGDEAYPTVLIACPNPRIETKTLKHIDSLLQDFDIYATTTKALLNVPNQGAIWSDSIEPEHLISL